MALFDRVSDEARSLDPRKLFLTVLAVPFVALGWLVGRSVRGVAWVVGQVFRGVGSLAAFLAASVKVGWHDAHGRR